MGDRPSDESILEHLAKVGAKREDASLAPFFSLAGAHQYRRLYRCVRRFVKPGSRVLDWGAGSGHFSYFLAATGHETTAFTLQSEAMKSLPRSENLRVVFGDPANPGALPFPDRSFDAVASVGVLEHVHETGGNEAGALREIRRVLVPDGIFLCFHLPNRSSWIESAAALVPGKYRHERLYSRRSVQALFGGAGLDLLSLTRYGFLPRNFWGQTPAPIRSSRLVARIWNALDDSLGALAPPLCQNFGVVARGQGPAE